MNAYAEFERPDIPNHLARAFAVDQPNLSGVVILLIAGVVSVRIIWTLCYIFMLDVF